MGVAKANELIKLFKSIRGLWVSLSRIAKYLCPMQHCELLTNLSAMFSSLMVSVRAL